MSRSEGSQVHGYETWKAAVGDKLPLQDSARLLPLYKAIQRNELTIQYRDGEPVRYGRMIGVHVTYHATDRRVYKLKEGERSRVKKNVSFEEALSDETLRIPSPPRSFDESISERLEHDEDPRTGAARGIYEEMFEYAIKQSDREYPYIKSLVNERLVETNQEEIVADPDNENNSYKGMTSIYDTTTFSLAIAHDMDLPIEEDEQNTPKSLVELVDEGGNDRFINFLVWEEIDSPPRHETVIFS